MRLGFQSACFCVLVAACGSSGSSSNSTGGSDAGSDGTRSGSSSGSSSSSGSGSSSGSSSGGSGGSSGSSGSSSGSHPDGGATCSGPGYVVTGSIFQTSEPWNTSVDSDPVASQSSTIISWLSANGGWGNNNKFQIDTSITVLCADATTPMTTWVSSGCGLDCDASHTTFPVPPGGAIEGETGYACNSGGDCHMLVVDVSRNWLWEMYGAFSPPAAGAFNSVGGPIIWDLTHAYSPTLRGDGCTSSDAGGFPVAAMLFSADEVAAGHIDHAIRFILPNARIQDGDVYVHPATHTGVASRPGTRPNAPPYGVRMRLKSTFDVTTLPAGAQVVAKALQKYGMFLSDGGNIALTATSDQFTTAKWSGLLAATDLATIQVTDFDVVDLGALVTTGDTCTLDGYRVP